MYHPNHYQEQPSFSIKTALLKTKQTTISLLHLSVVLLLYVIGIYCALCSSWDLYYTAKQRMYVLSGFSQPNINQSKQSHRSKLIINWISQLKVS